MMKQILMCAGLIVCAIPCFAGEGNRCPLPEYAQLKGADKSELNSEYCAATRQAKSNMDMHNITQDLIRKKLEIAADIGPEQQQSLAEIKAAGSCKVAAGAYADALSRRFK